MIVVAHNRDIKRNRADRLIILLDETVAAQCLIVLDTDIAAELDLAGILRSLQLEGISVFQPVIRDLDLVAVLDLLLEHSVAVTDTAAIGRISERRQGIQEAGCQSSKSAVAERGVTFLVLHSVDVQSHIFQRFFHILVGGQVDQGIAQRAAHQKLHGHVVENLRILFPHLLGRCHPVIDDHVLHRIGYRLEDLLLIRLLQRLAEQASHIALHSLLEYLFIKLRFDLFLCHTGF